MRNPNKLRNRTARSLCLTLPGTWRNALSLCLTLLFILSLAGCGGTAAERRDTGRTGSSVSQLLEDAVQNADAPENADVSVSADAPENAVPGSGAEISTAYPDSVEADTAYPDSTAGTSGDWAVMDTASLSSPEAAAQFAHDGIDIDLTRMSAVMVYGQVSGMMYTPDEYVGKTIRMQGQTASAYVEKTGTTYYAILISDATACCAQGIEYRLPEGSLYPKDDAVATVTGTFELYDELGATYCRLGNAVVSA